MSLSHGQADRHRTPLHNPRDARLGYPGISLATNKVILELDCRFGISGGVYEVLKQEKGRVSQVD